MDDLKSIIGKVATGATLSRDEAASAFDAMMSGEATPSQMGGLLMALRVRGEQDGYEYLRKLRAEMKGLSISA